MAGALNRGVRVIDDPVWTRRNLTDALPRFERLEQELGESGPTRTALRDHEFVGTSSATGG